MPDPGLPDQPLERKPFAADMDQRAERIECDRASDWRRSIESIDSGEQAGVEHVTDAVGADHGIGDHRRVRIGRLAKHHDRLVSPIADGKVSQHGHVGGLLGGCAKTREGIPHGRIALAR